jgi:hypothetical protein
MALALALVPHRTVPFETEPFQCSQNLIGSTFDFSRRVEIFHSYQPLTLVGTGIEITGQSRQQ